ncbi:UEV-domain-containing protein [Yamadazyma tenuis ATCC 10573]|uniref:UEV-domain-containing protein n=1 Tax=Candida tenuis (strain ATCC 10573 / BCRC 21748 / CBS 615 / JCM 9827 / NBRC 10315 / NRRL Y-1498 / VKM Y-70) TaxID=590646 RepID=G3BDK1_CANTC|nr:UEV-domain-containing protein [Yamadazyma tenuis ATCC 10573]EGV60318.1 UEV-domain-containing protein [Yamadazyma tenuis ATCC 10573]
MADDQKLKQLPQQLINWLQSVLQPQYQNKQTTYTHIIQFLQLYFETGFRIRTRVYTAEKTGSSNLLINLFGKINGYIPIEIWIPLSYPFNATSAPDEASGGIPIVYAVPNNADGVFLKPGNFIDSQGKFYHPFLSQWFNQCKQEDVNILRTYNLVNLVRLLNDAFLIEPPIYRSNSPDAPQLPPKPPSTKILVSSSSQTNGRNNPELIRSPHFPSSIRSDTTGIMKNDTGNVSNIPMRYQAPLPIPPQQLSDRVPKEETLDTNISSRIQPKFVYPTLQTQNHSQSITELLETDLMDRDDRSQKVPDSKSHSLTRLSDKINRCLCELPPYSQDRVNKMNGQASKVSKLGEQLSYQNQQALANKNNLESHLSYLLHQLTSIKNLNNRLQQAIDDNIKDHSNVHFGFDQKMSLDEVVISDSVLTNQLYEISSEIKANNDCMSLIGGSFDNENELIDDASFDTCVKTVRGIGRDIFWLKLIKHDITNKMSI